jgi:hypothetical protein
MCFTTLTLTNLRLSLERGAIRRETTEMRRDQITDLQVLQTLPMRWLDVGDLILTGHSGERKQLVIMAVPRPETVAELLRAPKVVTTKPEASTSPVEVA